MLPSMSTNPNSKPEPIDDWEWGVRAVMSLIRRAREAVVLARAAEELRKEGGIPRRCPKGDRS